MSDEEFDPFRLTSGLPLSGATVTVIGLSFGYDSGYGADNCLAIVAMQPDEGDPATQLYSVGKNWEPGDRGSTLQHKSGKPTNMNDSTNWGRFIKAFTEMDGAKDAMAETRNREASPFVDTWLPGMRFKMGDLPWVNNLEKDEMKKNKILIVPVEYLGTVDGEAPKKPAASTAKKLAPKPGAAATKAAPAAAEPDGDDDETFGIDDPDVLKAIIKAAKAADSFDEFTDAADAIDGVSDNKAWTKAVYSSKPGSIWKTHGE